MKTTTAILFGVMLGFITAMSIGVFYETYRFNHMKVKTYVIMDSNHWHRVFDFKDTITVVTPKNDTLNFCTYYSEK